MRRLTRLRLLLALLVFAGLAGCASGVQLPQALPTSAAPVGLTATPTMAGDPLGEPEPTAGGEASPVTRLTGAGGTAVACAANTQRLPLVAGGHPVAAASRIVAAGDMLYVLADGALYRLSPAALNGEVAALEAALPTGGGGSRAPVQGLTAPAYGEASLGYALLLAPLAVLLAAVQFWRNGRTVARETQDGPQDVIMSESGLNPQQNGI